MFKDLTSKNFREVSKIQLSKIHKLRKFMKKGKHLFVLLPKVEEKYSGVKTEYVYFEKASEMNEALKEYIKNGKMYRFGFEKIIIFNDHENNEKNFQLKFKNLEYLTISTLNKPVNFSYKFLNCNVNIIEVATYNKKINDSKGIKAFTINNISDNSNKNNFYNFAYCNFQNKNNIYENYLYVNDDTSLKDVYENTNEYENINKYSITFYKNIIDCRKYFSKGAINIQSLYSSIVPFRSFILNNNENTILRNNKLDEFKSEKYSYYMDEKLKSIIPNYANQFKKEKYNEGKIMIIKDFYSSSKREINYIDGFSEDNEIKIKNYQKPIIIILPEYIGDIRNIYLINCRNAVITSMGKNITQTKFIVKDSNVNFYKLTFSVKNENFITRERDPYKNIIDIMYSENEKLDIIINECIFDIAEQLLYSYIEYSHIFSRVSKINMILDRNTFYISRNIENIVSGSNYINFISDITNNKIEDISQYEDIFTTLNLHDGKLTDFFKVCLREYYSQNFVKSDNHELLHFDSYEDIRLKMIQYLSEWKPLRYQEVLINSLMELTSISILC